MFERFVVAFDGSDEAVAAADLAFALADRQGVEVTLAHVIQLPHSYPEVPQMAPAISWLLERTDEEWRGRLQQLAARAPTAAAVSTEVVIATKPAPILLQLLDECCADVLVAGTHGVGGLKQTVLGSVSQQLLEHAPCSVLLAREGADVDRPPVVVAGLDGSAATPGVVAIAERAAAALSAQLVLAHVVDEHLPFASIDTTRALHEWARDQGVRVLKEARSRVAAPLDSIAEELREGRVTDELVAVCDERQPVLAVVGSRGLHGFKGLLLGSTARHVVNHAPCAVLVVREATRDDAS